MSGRWNPRSHAYLAVLVLVIAAFPARSGGGDDRLADPQRLETAQDERRITRDVFVEVSIPKTEFQLLEPIRLDVKAWNVSNRLLWRSAFGGLPEVDYRTFRIKVFDDKGNLLPKTRYHERDVPFRGMPVGASNGSAGLVFSPGEEIDGELVASLTYDMTSYGEYTILVEFPINEWSEIDGEKVQLVGQSEAITVRVVADPPRAARRVRPLSPSDRTAADTPESLETAQDSRRISSDVVVTASVAKTEFKQLEPIRVKVTAQNVTDRNRWFLASDHPYDQFRIKVYNARGVSLPKVLHHAMDLAAIERAWKNIASGQTIEAELVANLAYDMLKPGEYSILVEVPIGFGEFRGDDGALMATVAQSNVLKVQVVAAPLPPVESRDQSP